MNARRRKRAKNGTTDAHRRYEHIKQRKTNRKAGIMDYGMDAYESRMTVDFDYAYSEQDYAYDGYRAYQAELDRAEREDEQLYIESPAHKTVRAYKI